MLVTAKDFSTSLSVPEAIETRRSIRKYTDEVISNDDILKMIGLASRAPSSNNVQPWRVIAVTNKSKLLELQSCASNQAQVGSAAVTFVVYSDRQETLAAIDECVHPDIQGEERVVRRNNITTALSGKSDEDLTRWCSEMTYIFIGFFLLTLQSCGYATSSMLGFEPDKVKAMFNLPQHVHISALIACGRPNEQGYPTFRHEATRITRIE